MYAKMPSATSRVNKKNCLLTTVLTLFIPTAVGTTAARKRLAGDTSPLKCFFITLKPAGLGALAMNVRPPPATAPATTAYLSPSVKPSTSVLRNGMAAFRLMGSVMGLWIRMLLKPFCNPYLDQ